MTHFQINDHLLTQECDVLARAIIDEIKAGMAGDETLADYRDEMTDRAHEWADGHEWAIYHYKAILLCGHCNTDNGEQFLENVGMPETPTFEGLASFIAYGEIRARIEQAIDEMIEADEQSENSY